MLSMRPVGVKSRRANFAMNSCMIRESARPPASAAGIFVASTPCCSAKRTASATAKKCVAQKI